MTEESWEESRRFGCMTWRRNPNCPAAGSNWTNSATNLEMALGKLPPRIAQVFQLYEIEERPNREVCAQMNISESNLWVMLHRARKQLREQLDGWWSGKPAEKVSTAASILKLSSRILYVENF